MGTRLKQCGKCKQSLPKVFDIKELYVDHNHDDGKVRGLLCRHCNIGLGNFKENITALKNAVDYIKQGGAF